MRMARLWIPAIAMGALFVGAIGCSRIPWEYNYDWGMRSAVEQRRRAVVVFVSGSNRDAREMDWTVFADARVKDLMEEFVPVRQDFFMHSAKANELGVTEVPAVVVVRPDGSIAGSQSGQFTPESFRLFLIKHRFN